MKETQARRLEQDERRKEAIEQERKRKEAEKARKREIELEEVRKLREEKARLKAKAAMNRTYDEVPASSNAASSDLNSTYVKPGDGNTTVTMMAQKPVNNADSYDITPARHELPPEPNTNANNYDIQELRSDEDTDDDENPRKQVPQWAEGRQREKTDLTEIDDDYFNILTFHLSRHQSPQLVNQADLLSSQFGRDFRHQV